MKKFNSGFTLIELLVVIAIIGIIASVVVSQLDLARNSGGDAAVKQNLNNIRPSAEIFYSANSDSYDPAVVKWNGGSAGTCPTTAGGAGTSVFGDSSILKGIAAANVAGGNGGTRCMVTGPAFAIAVSMKTSGRVWCIDSVNAAHQYNGLLVNSISAGGTCN